MQEYIFLNRGLQQNFKRELAAMNKIADVLPHLHTVFWIVIILNTVAHLSWLPNSMNAVKGYPFAVATEYEIYWQ